MLWSNVTEITSADAWFGWKIVYDPAAGALYSCQPSCPVTAVDTLDRYTIVYHLNRVDSAFLLGDVPPLLPVAWPGAWNRADIGAGVKKLADPTWNPGNPSYPTDGPYQVARVIPSGIDYRPMKHYDVMSCGALIRTLRFRYVGSVLGMIADLRGHKVDLSDGWAPDQVAELAADSRHAFRVHVDPSQAIEHAEFNVDAVYAGKPNPLHDVRVRQALALALDKRALIAKALGYSSRQVSNVIQWSICVHSPKYSARCANRSITGQWDAIAKRYDPNPGRGVALLDAKKLLAGTRWRRGPTPLP
jgi:ABC-type transport system substrate-binding protein